MSVHVELVRMPALFDLERAAAVLENDRDVAHGVAVTGPELDGCEEFERMLDFRVERAFLHGTP